MLTGEIRNQVDRVWDVFWTGGISNPLEVIEQLTYLLFIKRLDELHTLRENKANRLRQPIENPIFASDQGELRWSSFKHREPRQMYDLIVDEVFPFMKSLGGENTAFAAHIRDARFTLPPEKAGLLARVVDMLDHIPMEGRDTKGDLYEYMLSKLSTAGQNGQFRTPRHIIKLMVEMMAPTPSDTICDPACGTAGFLVAASEYLNEHYANEIYASPEAAWRFNHDTFHGFDFERVARMKERDVERLVGNAAIVRHRGKIESTINNAKRAIELADAHDSLDAYFWTFVPPAEERPKKVVHAALSQLGKTPTSTRLSKELKKKGWSFVGPTTVYAFMQAMGLVNDHLEGCCCRHEVEALRNALVRPA